MQRSSTAAAAALAIPVWAVGAAVFFRKPLLSGFALVNGDAPDGKMITYMHEHLFRWLVGQASFGSPAIFYPQPGVLGYSDAFILDVLPYSGLRLAGADPFVSMQLLTIVLSALSRQPTADKPQRALQSRANRGRAKLWKGRPSAGQTASQLDRRLFDHRLRSSR